MTEIPPYLQKRAQEARDRARLSEGSANQDPFVKVRTEESERVARLAAAKIALVTALGPIRQQLEETPTSLQGQLVGASELRYGHAFTPRHDVDTAASLTLYGTRLRHIGVEGSKGLRVAEERAWRFLVPKRELTTFMKGTGLRPIRDTVKLARGDSFHVEEDSINPQLVSRVFNEEAASRITNAVVLYEGNPDEKAYSQSYGRRYGVSATIVRNPASTPEVEGRFGVDMLSVDKQARVDEIPLHDGTKMDFERVAMPRNFGHSLPSGAEVVQAIEAAAHVMRTYGQLLETPTEQQMFSAVQATDSMLSQQMGRRF